MTAHPATRPATDATGAPHGEPATLPTGSALEVTPEPATGADLALITLRRAQADARKNPVQTKRRRAAAPRGATRTDGRDPNLLGGIINQLVVDNQWEGQAAGADLKKKWPSLLGETRAAHWEADEFDEATGTLRVLCDSAPWAANLRLLAPQVIAEVNEKFEQLLAKANEKRKTSPLRRLDVRVHSGRSTASSHDVEAPAPETPAPALRTERAAEPSAEYRRERARQAEARAARKAAGEPACPQPSTAPAPALRQHHGDDPSAEYRGQREQREQIGQAREATHDQVLAAARNERSTPTPDAFYAYAS
ncbi:DciA family protein [Streptomyces sp. NPDC051644]|uniref:DciA family protein n=1 Tax=Streptomyces sp. NPDC051644 TaxID=3365666 RepID=UPI0037B633BB